MNLKDYWIGICIESLLTAEKLKLTDARLEPEFLLHHGYQHPHLKFIHHHSRLHGLGFVEKPLFEFGGHLDGLADEGFAYDLAVDCVLSEGTGTEILASMQHWMSKAEH